MTQYGRQYNVPRSQPLDEVSWLLGTMLVVKRVKMGREAGPEG